MLVEPISWPSPVRIRLLHDFDDFHLAIGGWTSSRVDEGGDCRSKMVATANHLVPSLDDKEETGYLHTKILHSLNVVLAISIEILPLSD